MATLVLSTVGSALGGPLGGALGGLIGQSIDQSLFGSGIRRGPRLGDLSVQTSSYGSPIPRIYGTMRVAGTVVWATGIQESENIEGGGKGTPEQIAYLYSANFAVALSSRPIRNVRRIWADGKLIRGANGDWKVRTTFRLHTGSEDQQIDPLIASVETIEKAPAYRGIALAVFEGLELSEFGNRIPVLTFEVEADEAIVVEDLLRDASGGVMEADDSRPVPGFAAYGTTVAEAVGTLVELLGVDLVEREGRLRIPGGNPPVSISGSQLGCDPDGRSQASVERFRAPASAMAASIALTYYDPDRDYQSGQMRASAGRDGARSERVELPAVLTAGQAKVLAEAALSRKWRSGDRTRLRLPPSHMSLRPGDAIRLSHDVKIWKVRSVTIEGLAVVIEAEASPSPAASLPADPGRAVLELDAPIGRTSIALFELPPTGNQPADSIVVQLAASAEGSWKPVPVELVTGQAERSNTTAIRRSVLGRAENALAARAPMIADCLSTLMVRLENPEQSLFNADDDALAGGANFAALGDELIQFGRADEVEAGLYRLSHFLRGRRGTEWAAGGHLAGEAFCLIDPSAIRAIEFPPANVGAELDAVAHGIGDVAPLPRAERRLTGEAMRPPSPCHLSVSRNGDTIKASWVRRSHFGWTWVDGVGAPGDQFAELYRVHVEGPAGQSTIETSLPALSCAVSAMPGQPGDAIKLSVVTIGPSAVSREISTNFIL